MQKVLITGGTGTVGKALIPLLVAKGYGVHIYTRSATKNATNTKIQYFEWNPALQTYDAKALEGVVAVINLAGAGVADKRWTVERKKEILNSRVQSGTTLVKALQETKNQVKVIVQASATGYYGPTVVGMSPFKETDAMYPDFLGTTCHAWEQSIQAAATLGIRLVTMRIGIVLSKLGGMVKEVSKPMQLGILPVFGNGKQLVSWIHVNDLCALFLFAMENEVSGTYNAVADAPATQKELVKQLAKALHKKCFFAPPIPAFVLQLMLGEMSIEILKSCGVTNDQIKKAGFTFQYPALENIVL
jgi:uncharacterized protein